MTTLNLGGGSVPYAEYLSGSVDYAELGGGESLLKVCIVLLGESLLGDHEGPQPLPGHVVHLFVQPVIVLH